MLFVGKTGFVCEDKGKLILNRFKSIRDPANSSGVLVSIGFRWLGPLVVVRFSKAVADRAASNVILPTLFGGVGAGRLLFAVASEDQIVMGTSASVPKALEQQLN